MAPNLLLVVICVAMAQISAGKFASVNTGSKSTSNDMLNGDVIMHVISSDKSPIVVPDIGISLL